MNANQHLDEICQHCKQPIYAHSFTFAVGAIKNICPGGSTNSHEHYEVSRDDERRETWQSFEDNHGIDARRR